MSQDENQRVQRIKQYVLARLRDELATTPRGGQARLAKKLGVSGAHLSNMLSTNPTRQPGEDFRRKVAAHWGVSYAQLEAMAFGEEAPESTAKPVGGRATGGADVAPNLASVLGSYAWMSELPPSLRQLVREQARQHSVFGDGDLPPEEWIRILAGLEREALAFAARRDDPSDHTRRRRKRA